jgi:shikimate kinase
MLDPANEATLGRDGRVFCLTASPSEILERVTADASRIERPLLAVDDPHARIVELLAERADGYARFTQIATDGRPPTAIVEEIVALLEAEER